MKTPSLEEVKEYFKNAKEVKCIFDGLIYDISNIEHKFDINDSYIVLETPDNWDVTIFVYGHKKYAEIISYKEKTYQLSETFVKELIKEPNIKEAFIREGIIENDKLEVGKWYKRKPKGWDSSILFCWDGIYGNLSRSYGFNANMIWSEELCVHLDSISIELATPQEVETALINEAKKRGYGQGVTCLFGEVKDKRIIRRGSFRYNSEKNTLSLACDVLFKNGIWAEIIDETIEIKKSLILNTPNDLELGKLIRKMI